MQTFANPRVSYGKMLVELAAANRNIVALDADLGKSTQGYLIEERFPERHFEMSIAEQNMVSVAVGLALGGKIPFVHSFSTFLVGRAYDQIRVGVALGKANVKLIGSSCGLSDYGDGATHQSIEDVALMRALPNMTVIVPADAQETASAARAIAQHQGPAYLRINRNDLPTVMPPAGEFTIGKLYPLREGRDIVIFANGIMVHRALEAAAMLARHGVEAQVINVSTVKPLDREAVIAYARATGVVVTAEEHSVIGGLGGAIAETLAGECDIVMQQVGIHDQFGQSACTYEELLQHYQLTSDAIIDACQQVIMKRAKYRDSIR